MSSLAAAALALVLLAAPPCRAADKRLVKVDDLLAIRDVSEPQISPDGAWVAYSVRSRDLEANESNDDIWMAAWDGSRAIQVTFSKSDESTPRFSPDGKWLAFLSDRDDEPDIYQVWLLNRNGGEAERISDFKGGVEDFAWSPDSKRLAVIASDPDPEACGEKDKDCEEKTPKPIVITRYYFKEDIDGYKTALREHLYLFDLATRKAEPLLSGQYDEALPSWSPDGKSIAFCSKRTGPDPDRDDNWDVYVVAAQPGAGPRAVTTTDTNDCDPSWDSPPAWSPDGKSIAYLQGGPMKLIYYATYQVAVIPAAGGTPRLLAPKLDRMMTRPRFSADGQTLYFLLEDDRNIHLAKAPAAGGTLQRLVTGSRVVSDYALAPNGRVTVLNSTPTEPYEVFALDGANLRPLSRQNQDWLAQVKLGATEGISAKSKDGTVVNGLVVRPPDVQAGRKYPALLNIHGGPVGQFQNEFDIELQIFAAQGYVVVAMNPRGSSGRGEEFCKAIYADWGNKDAQDVLAGIDYVVAQGLADPARLGVFGWSYGGILTNYVISQDTRFKAAVSGASISNILAGFGTDMYVREYEFELGPPWKNTDVYLRLSSPFLHADRIVTPTLFMCGSQDFNVPLLNSEQMYQALRSLGRDTQLVIYPNQYHGLRKPSYLTDRMERHIAWFAGHLKP